MPTPYKHESEYSETRTCNICGAFLDLKGRCLKSTCPNSLTIPEKKVVVKKSQAICPRCGSSLIISGKDWIGLGRGSFRCTNKECETNIPKRKQREFRRCLVCLEVLTDVHPNTRLHPGKCKEIWEKKREGKKIKNQQSKREKLLQWQRDHRGASLPCEEYRVRLPQIANALQKEGWE